jgi:hypothetical protein
MPIPALILSMLAQEAMKALKGPGAPGSDPVEGGAAPGINMTPSKINEEILKADGQAPPVVAAGGSGNFAPVPGQQSQTDITTTLPPSEDLGIDPSAGGGKMSLEEKMAMAAQLGSLLRGPGAPPAPGGVGGGGPGINMQPVFLRDLRG